MDAQGTEAGADSQVTPEEPEQQPSVVDRVTSMPLISSTCDMVSAAYASTKESHPHVRTVCDAAEKGVRALTAAAVSGAQPILSRLEPQLTSASEYAHRGLDKLEENLPILQQPTEKVLADTKELVSAKVSEARDVVSHTVSSAKDSVATRVAGAVDVTRGAVQSGVDMTKSAVTSGVQSVMGSRVGQMVLSRAETVLGKSEAWADNHLPMTDAELARLATSLEGFDIASVQQQRQEQSYFVRLGSLSERLRQHAYEHSLGKLRSTKEHAQEALQQLAHALSLMETVKQGVDQKFLEGQEKLHRMWLSWNQRTSQGPEKDPAKPEVESRALAMCREVVQQLQGTCGSCRLGGPSALPWVRLHSSYSAWSSVAPGAPRGLSRLRSDLTGSSPLRGRGGASSLLLRPRPSQWRGADYAAQKLFASYLRCVLASRSVQKEPGLHYQVPRVALPQTWAQ
ncbi:perilipin-3 [Fukomys damarensis]|uniref:perilipin-3 n=1 Tax=Fukomys damarensis TaxID=885580 RepID=UPI00053F999F|nr:perilipin-3 [Fukomys damarensis]